MIKYTLVILSLSFVGCSEIKKFKGSRMGCEWITYQITDEHERKSITLNSHLTYTYKTLNRHDINAQQEMIYLDEKRGSEVYGEFKAQYKKYKKNTSK